MEKRKEPDKLFDRIRRFVRALAFWRDFDEAMARLQRGGFRALQWRGRNRGPGIRTFPGVYASRKRIARYRAG